MTGLAGIEALESIGAAHRSAVTAVDSASLDLNGATFKDTTVATPLECYGVDAIYARVDHNASGGTATGRLAYYDEDDDFIGLSTAITLNATGHQNGAGVYPSQFGIALPYGAHGARFVLTALATSTSVAIYLGTSDGWIR